MAAPTPVREGPMPAISKEIPELCCKFSTCNCFSPPPPTPIPTRRKGSSLYQAISRLCPKQSGTLTALLEKWEKREVSKDIIWLFFPPRHLYSHGIWAVIAPSTFAPIHFVSLAAASRVIECRLPRVRCHDQPLPASEASDRPLTLSACK